MAARLALNCANYGRSRSPVRSNGARALAHVKNDSECRQFGKEPANR